MNSEATSITSVDQDQPVIVHGSGSVAHQIIGEFLATLEKCDGYAEITKNLKKAIFDEKPTEATLRIAMFGENAL